MKERIMVLWHARWQFIRYFAIGFSAFMLDVGSLILVKEKLHIAAVWAVTINQIFILAWVFFLNKFWSFRELSPSRRQIVRFLMVAGMNYAIAVSVMAVFNHWLGLDYRLVRTGNIALSVSWNFLIYKYWVYKI